MVSSIVPGTSSNASALGFDTARAPRNGTTPEQRNDASRGGDRVELSGAASWNAARESVRAGLDQVHQALAIGHEAQATLLKVQALARDGGSQEQLTTLLEAFAARVDEAVAKGARVVAGEVLEIAAEPGTQPVQVQAGDLRLKQKPGADDVMQVARGAMLDDPALAGAVQRSLDVLQDAMDQLFSAAQSLELHHGLLGAAEGSLAANADIDADGARLLALQVRQGLATTGAIANAEPQAVLALFKA